MAATRNTRGTGKALGKGLSKGLGKGLDALISSDGIPEDTKDSVVELKINDISPNEGQPRKDFAEDALQELADSIKENGVIQPIIVQKKGSGYRIVAGERRWRASRLAGLKVIPAIVRELTDQQTMEQALIENLQREDLNPLEEAYAMQNLLKTHKLSQEQLAKRLGKPRATIANTVRLINIDESLQDFIRNGDLSAGHAKALLSLKDPEDQRKAADVIIAKDMTVRQAEEYVKKYLYLLENPEATTKPKKEVNSQFQLSTKEVEVKLKKSLGSKVKLKVADMETGRGKIVIDYKNYEDLDRLIEVLGG
jgi:ParB family chromosome partitioning protein